MKDQLNRYNNNKFSYLFNIENEINANKNKVNINIKEKSDLIRQARQAKEEIKDIPKNNRNYIYIFS